MKKLEWLVLRLGMALGGAAFVYSLAQMRCGWGEGASPITRYLFFWMYR